MDRADDMARTIHSLLETIIEKFRDELGSTAGASYRRRGAIRVAGDLRRREGRAAGLEGPITYRRSSCSWRTARSTMEAEDPAHRQALEDLLGVQQFAAIEVGDEAYILAFTWRPATTATTSSSRSYPAP